MTQDDINQAEWNNPRNWAGPKLFGIYTSKADTRLWVPKRKPSWGWTINVGHPGGIACLAGILVATAAFLMGTCILLFILVGVKVLPFRH